jgi:hypothetical protein
MRRSSRRLIAGDGVYRVVLDPSNYSKLIRFPLREHPEPDTLNFTVDCVVKTQGHFQKNPSVLSLRPSKRNSEILLLCIE